MYIDGSTMEQVQRFLQHAHSKTTETYILEVARKKKEEEEDKKRDKPLILVSSIVDKLEQPDIPVDVSHLKKRAPKKKRQPSSVPQGDTTNKRARVD